MKDLPPFGQSASGSSMSGVMAGGVKEKGVLMSSRSSKQAVREKSKDGSESTMVWDHQDPNTKQIL